MFILRNRGKLSILLLLLAIGSGVFISGALGWGLAGVFVLNALLMWTLPNPKMQGGDGRVDPKINRTSNIIMGVGLGMIGAVLITFLPPDYFLPVIGLVVLLLIFYLVRIWRRG